MLLVYCIYNTQRTEELEGAQYAAEHDVPSRSPLGEYSLLLIWQSG